MSESKIHYLIGTALVIGALVLLWHFRKSFPIISPSDNVVPDSEHGVIGSQSAPTSTPVTLSYNSPQVQAVAQPDPTQAYYTASQNAQILSGPVYDQDGNLASVGLPESYFIN